MYRLFTKREKIILYITIGVIVFGISFNFLIAPILARNESLNKEINLARTKLKKYLRLLSQKEHIQNKYRKFSSTDIVYGQSPDKLVNALSEIESLAKNAGIRIIDIRPQTSKSTPLYKELLIDLRTEGNIEGYLKFIYNIENSLSLIRIKRFQLSAKPNLSLEGIFSLSQLSASE